MTSKTPSTQKAKDGVDFGAPHAYRQHSLVKPELVPPLEVVEALMVPMIAESAEAVIEGLDAPLAAAPALLDCLETAAPETDMASSRRASGSVPMQFVVRVRHIDDDPRPFPENATAATAEAGAVSLDEYARAVLYNGLGHYHAARVAAQRACESDDFTLLDGALAELIEASVRSGSRDVAVQALERLETRAQINGSRWARGVASCGRALVCDDDDAEGSYLAAIEWLGGTTTRVALGRVHLLYGEWLRRRGRRVEARQHLTHAQQVFRDVRLSGFAERARRELLATGDTVRKRTDDTRLDLTAQEAQIAQLAAGRCTNPEIGERLFLSPRTVEWHLRKIFTKLGISSRRELNAILEPHLAPV